jgi:DNA-3-methyladenine glycosylase I
MLWAHEAPAPAPAGTGDVPASTVQSQALSAELRRQGFRFVGPTTVYAAMQSLGVVNDHLLGCHSRAVVEAERARFLRPA